MDLIGHKRNELRFPTLVSGDLSPVDFPLANEDQRTRGVHWSWTGHGLVLAIHRRYPSALLSRVRGEIAIRHSPNPARRGQTREQAKPGPKAASGHGADAISIGYGSSQYMHMLTGATMQRSALTSTLRARDSRGLAGTD